VVFEALASGAVPVVADFGGPGDIVRPDVGYKVALTSETDIVAQIEKILLALAGDRTLLRELRQAGICYAREHLTWEAKAQATSQVLHWVLRRAPKPDFVPPKMFPVENLS
jgi:glycosyltransferase involved in cell wall biosynthesis